MLNGSFRIAFVAGAALALAGPAATDEPHGDHVLFGADEFEYQSGPGSMAVGAEYAVLYGDPGESGLFAMRLRLPDGFHIAPHEHAQPEVVTVISGTFEIGMGDDGAREAATALAAGSFFAFPPGMVHYAYADGDTVIQLNSTGPWTIRYVDDADDPRIN